MKLAKSRRRNCNGDYSDYPKSALNNYRCGDTFPYHNTESYYRHPTLDRLWIPLKEPQTVRGFSAFVGCGGSGGRCLLMSSTPWRLRFRGLMVLGFRVQG